MPTNLVARPRSTRPSINTRSWFRAYLTYVINPHENIATKLLLFAALGIVPLSLLDDVLLPYLGVLDDIPTSLFVLFAAFRTWQRVRTYR